MASLPEIATSIWQAGVHAVLGDVCVRRHLSVANDTIHIGEFQLPLSSFRRLIVVGAGKAAGAMALGVENALGDDILKAKDAHGWLNVPEGTREQLRYFHLDPARPAGINEPTQQACRGTQEIVRLVRSASEDDLCLFLLSGGASALLVAPVEGISIDEKQAVVRKLSAAGADIRDLNTVRRAISTVKAGGLARECRSGRLFTLVLSDVIGDPLDVIGSAPTYPVAASPAQALEILERYGVTNELPTMVNWLQDRAKYDHGSRRVSPTSELHYLIVGNLLTAIEAAATKARNLGFTTTALPITEGTPTVDDEAESLTLAVVSETPGPGRRCFISGGEPVLQLVDPSIRGRGGRNQQLALRAGLDINNCLGKNVRHWVLLSAGTDGEDGPTDAAGAYWDENTLSRSVAMGLDPIDYLRRNDANTFFERVGGLLRSGPTGTNVCDLRVCLVNTH